MRTLLLFLLLTLTLNAQAICNGTEEQITDNDPVGPGSFTIEARVYRPYVESGQKFPVVFILPPIVGETPVDGALALNMCLQGIGAYVLNVRNNDSTGEEEVTNLNTHEDSFIRAEFGVQKFIDQLKSDAEVSNFGIMGASYGGILAAYLSGVMRDLKASVIIAGAGNVKGLLARSSQEGIRTLRDRRLSLFNLGSPSAYERFMNEWVTRDPLFVADKVPGSSSLIFVMLRDSEVPTTDQNKLASGLPSPTIIRLNRTHIPGIIEAATIHSQKIITFLKTKLI